MDAKFYLEPNEKTMIFFFVQLLSMVLLCKRHGVFLTFFFLLAQQTYDANADAVFPKSQVTDFHARFVRVIPEQWHFRPCMKLELKGCEGDFFYIFY